MAVALGGAGGILNMSYFVYVSRKDAASGKTKVTQLETLGGGHGPSMCTATLTASWEEDGDSHL
ncbi:hypothetical protein OUZ56_004961 [Daphnia magna]|uniref:Uncharacterized protein n=1 Tax=Daphnia magna TaxID=35525 RepID=A0ABQ9YRC9_9CRUS|nr:hypothetical protein OUZ56_004961 [Daphnia magna]